MSDYIEPHQQILNAVAAYAMDAYGAGIEEERERIIALLDTFAKSIDLHPKDLTDLIALIKGENK